MFRNTVTLVSSKTPHIYPFSRGWHPWGHFPRLVTFFPRHRGFTSDWSVPSYSFAVIGQIVFPCFDDEHSVAISKVLNNSQVHSNELKQSG